jgi:sRNA-binding regulator protein Hfq
MKLGVDELNAAEHQLLRQAAVGEQADLSGGQADIDVSQGAQWGADRQIRAEVLYALCTRSGSGAGTDGGQPGTGWVVHTRGVRLRGAKITAGLDLSFAQVRCRLVLVDCFFDGDESLGLEQARLPALDLSGSYLPGIAGDGLRIEGDLVLANGFSAQGCVSLVGARIGGSLICSRGWIANPQGNALHADRIAVDGSVFLRNRFAAQGEVRLLGTKSAENLECDNSTFTNPQGYALNADGITVGGNVYLRNEFTSQGEVHLLGTKISGQLDCGNGTFTNPQGDALNAERMIVGTDVFLSNGFEAQGEVRLLGAKIGGNLRCTNGTFDGQEQVLKCGASVGGRRVRLAAGSSACRQDQPDRHPGRRATGWPRRVAFRAGSAALGRIHL